MCVRANSRPEALLMLVWIVILGQVLPNLIYLILIKMVGVSFSKIDLQLFDPRKDLSTGSVHCLGCFVYCICSIMHKLSPCSLRHYAGVYSHYTEAGRKVFESLCFFRAPRWGPLRRPFFQRLCIPVAFRDMSRTREPLGKFPLFALSTGVGAWF